MPGHEIPAPLTLPDPDPATATVRRCCSGDCAAFAPKVAVTLKSKLVILTEQVAVPEHPPPLQPVKLEPEIAAGVKVTVVPSA